MARREDEEGVMMTQMSNTWFNILQLDPFLHRSVGGIVVSIAAFQAVDPGSIPGRRISRFWFQYRKNLALTNKSMSLFIQPR